VAKVDVVVVDDDDGVRWVLTELLTHGGFSCEGASSGSQGLRLLEQHRPDVAIVDLKLGSMTGLEVAGRLQGLSPDTRVILLTGYPEALNRIGDDCPGVAAVLAKPFDVGELLGLVTELVGSSPVVVSEEGGVNVQRR